MLLCFWYGFRRDTPPFFSAQGWGGDGEQSQMQHRHEKRYAWQVFALSASLTTVSLLFSSSSSSGSGSWLERKIDLFKIDSKIGLSFFIAQTFKEEEWLSSWMGEDACKVSGRFCREGKIWPALIDSGMMMLLSMGYTLEDLIVEIVLSLSFSFAHWASISMFSIFLLSSKYFSDPNRSETGGEVIAFLSTGLCCSTWESSRKWNIDVRWGCGRVIVRGVADEDVRSGQPLESRKEMNISRDDVSWDGESEGNDSLKVLEQEEGDEDCESQDLSDVVEERVLVLRGRL